MMKKTILWGIVVFISAITISITSCSNKTVTEPEVRTGVRIEYYVGSRNTSSVKRYDSTGAYIDDFIPPGSGGLNTTQDLLFIHDSLLLVTGRGNTAIKKYSALDGTYLGDFSVGYVLDNPTKMLKAGPYIYVSQWGAVQNKIVRFDVNGNFVEEFTSVGVPNGLGTACDNAGNFYAASYGTGSNGTIMKFYPDGTFKEILVNSGNVMGPSNIWFDQSETLFVADWTLGNVQMFDTSGQFLGTYISGMTNIEGYAFGSNGSLFLCDWTENIVNRYDNSGNFISTFISTGGLNHPNCITIREVAN